MPRRPPHVRPVRAARQLPRPGRPARWRARRGPGRRADREPGPGPAHRGQRRQDVAPSGWDGPEHPAVLRSPREPRRTPGGGARQERCRRHAQHPAVACPEGLPGHRDLGRQPQSAHELRHGRPHQGPAVPGVRHRRRTGRSLAELHHGDHHGRQGELARGALILLHGPGEQPTDQLGLPEDVQLRPARHPLPGHAEPGPGAVRHQEGAAAHAPRRTRDANRSRPDSWCKDCLAGPRTCHFEKDEHYSYRYYDRPRMVGQAYINCTRNPITDERPVKWEELPLRQRHPVLRAP